MVRFFGAVGALAVVAAPPEVGAVEEGIGAAHALVTRRASAMKAEAAFAVALVRSRG
jgi:hypothetical protein